jgi:hypothetical protein
MEMLGVSVSTGWQSAAFQALGAIIHRDSGKDPDPE